MASVNLGKKPSDTKLGDMPKEVSNKVYFPSLFLSDVPELDNLPDGLFKFEGTGQVTSHTEKVDPDGTKHCSCEIEIHSIEPMGDSKSTDLGKALDKVAADKEDAADESDPSDDEETEGEETD